jgi:hypothetical protein
MGEKGKRLKGEKEKAKRATVVYFPFPLFPFYPLNFSPQPQSLSK